MAEPIVTGFGITTEAAINNSAAKQWATNFTKEDIQQSTTTKVIFFISIKEFVELVTLIPFLTNFKARPPGNR